ncbi:MAG: phosphoribosyltransferase family protein [Candidatus Azambacteria bacterium]|nr:phosphoribosyltransferase family protein [Candidatus Azambacteria bacterium]
MDDQKVLQILGKVGAVITNSHVVYPSGKHGTTYVNKDTLYAHPLETSKLCREMALRWLEEGESSNRSVDVVIAPAIGGVILSQWTAYHLSEITGREIFGVYAEKVENGDAFVIKRGYDKIVAGKNVLVVKDVLTIGGSAKKVIEAVRALGGNIIGLGVLCNCEGVTPHDVADPPKLFALVKLDAWDEDECKRTGPCSRGVPINTDVGRGK